MRGLTIGRRSFLILAFFLMPMGVFALTSQEKAIAIYEQNLTTPFHHIDFNGNINFVQNITGFQTKEDFVYLHVKFNSSSRNYSPFAGYGWTLPFFESSFYPFADNLYVLNMPEGTTMIFVRDRKNPNVLHGRGDWKAVLDEEKVKITSRDTVFVYKKGRLCAYRTKSFDLTFLYGKDGVLEKIKEKSKDVVKIERQDDCTTIKTRNRTIVLSLSIRVFARTKIDKIEVLALSNVNTSRFNFRYEYRFDEIGNPQLKTPYYALSWDTETKLAKKINDLSYEIKPAASNIVCSAMIHQSSLLRKNADIFWQKNITSGVETYDSHGVKNVTFSFPSGVLKGKIRRKEQYYQGKLTDQYDYSYNEKRKLTRVLGMKTDSIYVYEDDGVTLSAVVRNGVLEKEITSNAKKLAMPYLKDTDKKGRN